MHVHRTRRERIAIETMTFDQIVQLDRRLVELGRGLGGMRLWLGEGLLALESAGGVGELGFPTLASYSLEALVFNQRWAADARALARRLVALPKMRAALVSGRLSWSKVELIARVATSDDEDEWSARAAAMTVRALRALISRSDSDADDEEMTTPQATLCVPVDRFDALAFEQARLMVKAVGAHNMDEAVEAMLAEGLSEILARMPDVDLPSGIGGASEDERSWREALMRMRREDEAACEARGFFHDGHASIAVGVRAEMIGGRTDRLGISRFGADLAVAQIRDRSKA